MPPRLFIVIIRPKRMKRAKLYPTRFFRTIEWFRFSLKFTLDPFVFVPTATPMHLDQLKSIFR